MEFRKQIRTINDDGKVEVDVPLKQEILCEKGKK